jgi:hypothetical protein
MQWLQFCEPEEMVLRKALPEAFLKIATSVTTL